MLVIATALIEGVIGEVHEALVEVAAAGRLVGYRTEAGHAAAAEKELQWVQVGHQHVHPQVELEPVQEERPADVLLHHCR